MLAHGDRSQSRADSMPLRYGQRSKSSSRKSKSTHNVESQRPTRVDMPPLPTRKPRTPPRKMAQSDGLQIHPDCTAEAPQDPEGGDELPTLPSVVTFALLSHCRLVLKSGQAVESVTDDEFLRAIDKTLRRVLCNKSDSGSGAGVDADAVVDADGFSGTVDTSGSGWQQSGESSTAAPNGAPSQYSNFTAKRGREPDDDGHDEDPWRRKPPADYNAREALESTLGSSWACPYFWFDQVLYRDCLQYKLRRISDVRTHIGRCHKQDPHCPSCGLSFVNMKVPDRVHHIRERACTVKPNPGAAYPGATKDMLEQISHEGNGQTQLDKWYAIWRILFPGRDEPAKPFAPVTEVAFAITSYVNRFIESSPTTGLQQRARQSLPNDWVPMDNDTLSVLTRLSQFVIAWERHLEALRAQISGNGTRNRHGRPALQPTTSQPGGTPSLVSTSSQPTFTNTNNPATELGNAIGLLRPMAVLVNNPSFVSSDAQMNSQMTQCDDGLLHPPPSSHPVKTPPPSGQQAPNLVPQQPTSELNPGPFDPFFSLDTNYKSFGQGGNPSWSSDQFS